MPDDRPDEADEEAPEGAAETPDGPADAPETGEDPTGAADPDDETPADGAATEPDPDDAAVGTDEAGPDESEEGEVTEAGTEPVSEAETAPDDAEATDPLTDVDTDTEAQAAAGGADASEPGRQDRPVETAGDDAAKPEGAGDEVYCSSCGEAMAAEAAVCPNCGVRQRSGANEKEPILAALLSFIIPGAGQVYNGQVGRGAIAFVGALVLDFVITVMAVVLTLIVIGPLLFLLIPVVHAVIMYDAYHQAELINEGKVVP